MKNAILPITIVFTAVLWAQAEICPLWDSITVTTSDSGQTVSIKASQDAKRLTSVVVNVDTNTFSVPVNELADATDPQLHTLRFGYWSKDLKRFYVFVTCGRLNSSPYGKQPMDLYFYFDNGKYSEVRSMPTPTMRYLTTEQAGPGYPPQGVGSPDP